MKASILVDDFVVKPVLASRKIGGHRVFVYPQAGELSLFVDGSVKKAIEASGCTGIEFSRAAIR